MLQTLKSARLAIAGTALILATLSSCTDGPVGPSPQIGSTAKLSHHTFFESGQVATKHDAALGASQTFIVDNKSSQSLGSVDLSDSTDSFLIPVGASEIDTADLSFGPTSVGVSGQVCQYPDSTIFTLPSGAKVAGNWSSPQSIVIIDYRTQN